MNTFKFELSYRSVSGYYKLSVISFYLGSRKFSFDKKFKFSLYGFLFEISPLREPLSILYWYTSVVENGKEMKIVNGKFHNVEFVEKKSFPLKFFDCIKYLLVYSSKIFQKSNFNERSKTKQNLSSSILFGFYQTLIFSFYCF